MTLCTSPCSSCSSLPSYSSGEPPHYSCRLSLGERSLQETPRIARSLPSGTYVKKAGNVTVILFDQEDGVKIPIYGRNGLINGTVTLEDVDKSRVIYVYMKVGGRLDVVTTEGGSRTTQLFSRCCTLWKRESCSDACPGFFSFSCVIPPTSTFSGSDRPLPPTYDVSYPGVPSLFVKCKYYISFYVTSIRNHTLDLLTKTKTLDIPFQYIPRTRAHRPIVSTPCFYSSIKTLPEEWYQIVTPIPPRAGLQLEPLYCQFFIPASKIYGLRDKIPFHIQLSGTLPSLRKFLMLPCGVNATPCLTAKKSPLKSLVPPRVNFKISLVRQTRVETRAAMVWRNAPIGAGEARQVVPPFSCSSPLDGTIHLDWEGEISIDTKLAAGSFTFDTVIVKDNVILSIQPFSQEKQPPSFLPATITIPVRLVTDSYVEEADTAMI